MLAGFLLARNQSATGTDSDITKVELADVDGKVHEITEWTGKIVLLNFWATWCVPCREEIPLFMEAQANLGDYGLQVIGIALDDPEAVRAFRDEVGMDYPTLIADDSTVDLMSALGNQAGALPYSVLLDPDYQVEHSKLGPFTRDELDIALRPLL